LSSTHPKIQIEKLVIRNSNFGNETASFLYTDFASILTINLTKIMENQELKDVQGILTRSQKKQKLFGSDLLDGNFLSDQDRRRHDVENDGEDGKILTSDVEEDDTDEVHDELIDLVRDKLYHEFVEVSHFKIILKNNNL
jgi:hypothetical protein